MCYICYVISLCSVSHGNPEDVCVIFVMLLISVVYHMVSQRMCVLYLLCYFSL